MATKKNPRVIKFVLTDDDYLAFGRYRILYTEGGRKLVNRQRLTYFISGLCIAALFTLFHADHQFTMINCGGRSHFYSVSGKSPRCGEYDHHR